MLYLIGHVRLFVCSLIRCSIYTEHFNNFSNLLHNYVNLVNSLKTMSMYNYVKLASHLRAFEVEIKRDQMIWDRTYVSR